MKLLEMKIVNFRQFAGEQTILFAAERAKNITVIHGYNGAGKTALLNAFVWCLYGKTTPDLDQPNRLLSEAAEAELVPGQEATAEVRLKFDARDFKYDVHRKARYRRSQEGGVDAVDKPRVEVFRTGLGGATESVANPEVQINQILPSNLHRFFFFNGERVEAIARPDAYEDVEEGVKTLLDVEIYARSVRHLQTQALAHLTTALGTFGGAESSALAEDYARAQAREAELLELQAQQRSNEQAIEAELQVIDDSLRRVGSVRDLVAKRSEATLQAKNAAANAMAIRHRQARLLSRHGYLALAAPVLERAAALLRAVDEGDVHRRNVSPHLVDELISSGTCLCGRTLGPSEEDCLRALGASARTADGATRAAAELSSLRTRRLQYSSDLREEQARLAQELQDCRRFREETDELSAKIGHPENGEQAEDLERRRSTEHRRLAETKVELVRAERDLDLARTAQRDAQTKMDKQQLQDERAKLVQRRAQAVRRVTDAFEQIYELQRQDVRRKLSDKLSEIWTSAAVKDYSATLSEDFRLDLRKKVAGRDVPVAGASTGEKQILALSFVGTLVWKAAENERASREDVAAGNVPLVAGGQYPLVMDSPFGALEDDYRSKVAEWIPTLANQVIVMVSKTQWRDEVESAMRERIGREYVLELHTPKAGAQRTIDVAGRQVPYVVETTGAELTRIVEVV